MLSVFFAKMAKIKIASLSMRYTIRHVRPSSLILSSWHRDAIEVIGRDCGMLSFSPPCRRLRRKPASIRAALEKGGVLTSPWSHERGLSLGLTKHSVCQHRHMSKTGPVQNHEVVTPLRWLRRHEAPKWAAAPVKARRRPVKSAAGVARGYDSVCSAISNASSTSMPR